MPRRGQRKKPAIIEDMKRNYLALLLLLVSAGTQAAGVAIELELDGPLGVATTEYLIDGIHDAEERNANLVIIRMDTPGGLMEPMRDIVKAILNSSVPVVTYVAPGGARADSAGTYILLASHVAAMAPTTHLGAATPVTLGGEDAGDDAKDDQGNDAEDSSDKIKNRREAEDPAPDTNSPDSAMGRKVLNDAIAYIRGLADAHGRNAD